MFTVYILYSHKDKKLYSGQTKDICNRLKLHKSGKVKATTHRRPLTCIYTEEYKSRKEAGEREKFFKSLWSARLKSQLKDGFENGKLQTPNIFSE